MSRQRLQPIIDRNIRTFQPETQGQEVLYVNHILDSFAAGYRVVRFFVKHVATVLTGTLYACYSRAENRVANMTGTVVGSAGYAANYAASASGNINAGEFVALTKGVNAGTVRAGFFQIDGGGGAATSAKHSVVVANNQSAGTVTDGPYAFEAFDNSDANASGAPFKAFLKCTANSVSPTQGPVIDATGVKTYVTTFAGITLTTGDRPLFAYQDDAGVKHVLVVIQNNTDIAIRS